MLTRSSAFRPNGLLSGTSSRSFRAADKDEHDHHHKDKDSDKAHHHDSDHESRRDHDDSKKREDHDKDELKGGHDHDHDHDGGKEGGKDGGKGGTKGDGGSYKGPVATPFLVIPSGDSDAGARPIPAALAIRNESIQANIANPTVSTGWADFELQLSCVVADLGVVGCATGIAEFYVGDEFSAWHDYHEELTPAQIKANAKLVGYATFKVPPGGTATVMCRKLWKPGSSTAAMKGVLVQVYDLFTDHLTSPFDAINDRHVARNDDVMDPVIF